MSRADHDSPIPVLRLANEPAAPSYRRRVVSMALLWLAFGAVVGNSIGRPEDGVVGLVAGVMAGVIVLVPFGLILGLAGGRWTEALIGGAAGQVIGFAAGLQGGWGGPALLATVGLVYGALVGATLLGLFYRLPRLLLAFRPLRQPAAPMMP